ncbi:MAG: ABC transporter ATP-binding protein [Rhodothermales bacterium]
MKLLPHDTPPISISGLMKSFGTNQVLAGIDLTFGAGETTAIVGPNGAGKTTLIKSLLGLVHPDAGVLEVGGLPAGSDGDYRRLIGYMPQSARFPDGMSARDMIALVRRLRDPKTPIDTSLIRTLGLSGEMDKPFRTLSGGTRQKVSAVLAFMYTPPIYILDEPTAGLDPVSSAALKDHILAVRERGATVLLTSHVMADLEELCDRIVFLLDGRVRFDGSLSDLRARTGQPRLERAIARILEGEAA